MGAEETGLVENHQRGGELRTLRHLQDLEGWHLGALGAQGKTEMPPGTRAETSFFSKPEGRRATKESAQGREDGKGPGCRVLRSRGAPRGPEKAAA